MRTQTKLRIQPGGEQLVTTTTTQTTEADPGEGSATTTEDLQQVPSKGKLQK